MNQTAARGADDGQPQPVGRTGVLPTGPARLSRSARPLDHLLRRLPAHLTVELCGPATAYDVAAPGLPGTATDPGRQSSTAVRATGGGVLMTTVGAMTTRGAGRATGMTSLEEIRAFRARLLYDNGRRPAFRLPSGDYADPDPVDERAYHVVARDGRGGLVGCVRLAKVELMCPSAVEAHLGYERAARLISDLAVPRSRIVELGRLAVTKEHRGQSLTPVMLIGCVALSRHLDHQVLWGLSGTRDRQHRLFDRLGSRMVPDSTAYVPKYDDELCVHILDQRDPKPGFEALNACVGAFSFDGGD